MSTGNGDNTSGIDGIDRIDDATALPALSEPDEAFVRGLLAGLPPVPVPGDLAARLDAALRAEAESAVGTLGPDAAAEAGAAGAAGVAATVLPLDAARVARGLRRTRILQVAAAALVLVAGGFGVVKLAGGGSSPGSAVNGLSRDSGGAAAAPSAGGTYVVTRSGHAYDDNTLVSDVRALASHQALTDDTQRPALAAVPSPLTTFSQDTAGGSLASGAATASSPPSKSDVFSTFMSSAELVPCLAAVEDGLTTPVTPIAVDEGTYRGQPALVVVLPDLIEPKTTYDVFVVGAQCGQNQDVHLLTYQTVTIH